MQRELTDKNLEYEILDFICQNDKDHNEARLHGYDLRMDESEIAYWMWRYAKAQTAGQAEVRVRQGDFQPVFACAIDRDLFIKNAGTWMDVDTFCETVNERDEIRICNNCKYWDKTTMDCEEEDLFGCIELAQSPYNDGTFGCKKFTSKQTA